MSDVNKAKYGWSRWGGAMYGLVKSEGEWVCQGCGKDQPVGVPQYYFPWDKEEREYVRLCSVCKHIQLSNKIPKYQVTTLFTIIRKEFYE